MVGLRPTLRLVSRLCPGVRAMNFNDRKHAASSMDNHPRKRRQTRFLCFASVIAAFTAVMPQAGSAEGDVPSSGQAELEKAARSLVPRPSTDTTPIEVSVGGIHYRIPRNYLVTMEDWSGKEQGLITLRVNLTDMSPVTEATIACFRARPTERPLGCEPFDFRITSGGPAAEQILERSRDRFHDQNPTEMPFGLEKYQIGSGANVTEYYVGRLNDRLALYWCTVHESDGKHYGTCRPEGDKIYTGAAIDFFLNPNKISEIAAIDDKIRALVKAFTVSGGSDR